MAELSRRSQHTVNLKRSRTSEIKERDERGRGAVAPSGCRRRQSLRRCRRRRRQRPCRQALNYRLDVQVTITWTGSLSLSLFSFWVSVSPLSASSSSLSSWGPVEDKEELFTDSLFFTSLHPLINICEETCFNAWHHFGPRWRVCVLTGEKSGPTGLDIRLKPQRAWHNQQSRRCIIRLFFFFWPSSSSLTCWPRPPCLTGEVCQEVFWSVFRGVTGA